jgi:hypothetical protein
MGWAVSGGSEVKSTQSMPFRSRSRRGNSDEGISVRTGLPGVKKIARIKFSLQKDGFFTIFKVEINYLEVVVENIKLMLDKVKKMFIILIETQRKY